MNFIFNLFNFLSASLRHGVNLRHWGRQNEILAPKRKVHVTSGPQNNIWSKKDLCGIATTVRFITIDLLQQQSEHFARHWGDDCFINYFINSTRKSFFTLFFYRHACTKNAGVSMTASTGGRGIFRISFRIVFFQMWNSNLRLAASLQQTELLLPQSNEEEHSKL